jgi:hypothetical protein
VENQKNLQLQKLFQITFSYFTNFKGIFLPAKIFLPLLIQFLAIQFCYGKELVLDPLVIDHSPLLGARLAQLPRTHAHIKGHLGATVGSLPAV